MMIFNTDILIVLISCCSFLFFLIVHFFSFRFLKAEFLFEGIKLTFLTALLIEAIVGFFVFRVEGVFYLILAITIYSLFSFFYILCIFGPFETSIRMRLIREISKDTQGKTRADIMALYNERVILDIRLARLLGSKDVIKQNDRYLLGKNNNAFFILDTFAGFLHGFIHKR